MFQLLLKDLRHALRLFASSPAFTATAVAALTLGIGTSTAVFSVVNAVLLKPVPFPDPDRLVIFMNTSPQGSGPAASPAKFQHYRQQTEVVRDVSAFRGGVVNYTGGAFPEQLRLGQVSADYFRLFGAPILRGRTFTSEEDLPDAPAVAVISRALWQSRFNSADDILGTSISLSGEPHTIIGILGDFSFDDFDGTAQVWIPFRLDPLATDQGHYFQVAGRLQPVVTLEQAQARLQLSADEYRAKYPNAIGPNNSFTVEPVRDVLVRNVRSSLLVLGGAVSFVLLIACANVASLLLVRATGRRREIAIRAAIGGTRTRIVRQLLTESLLLSLAGGLLGLVLGWAGIRALLSINTAGLPRVGELGAGVALDWRVAAFAVVVSVFTGVLFGLMPALQASRVDLATTLKEGGGRAGTGFRQNAARSVLVVAEIALAVVLLIGTALLIRTSIALGGVDPGFDATNVLTMRTSLAGPQYQSAQGVEQLIRNGIERVRTVPGVVEAGATCCVPLQGGYGLPFTIVGRAVEGPGPYHGGGGWTTVSPGYFEVFRIPVRRGRSFTERDTSSSTPVAIINEAMARQYWGDADPLNDRLVIGRGVMREFERETDRQIVGVVGDVRTGGLDNEPGPMMFIPQAQVPDAVNALNLRLSPMAWVVRTAAAPHTLSSAVQEELRQATGLPVTDVRPMSEVVSRSISRQRFNMWLMTVFGASALLLAAIGVYGLMAYSVEQRTQEIGIRLALGAQPGQVRRLVVRQGLWLTLAGVAIGLGAAFGLSRLLAAFLYGVTTHDPLVFAAVPIMLTAVALLAIWHPARHASRVDPLIALREA
jgi:putative ABC transport system permease protein